MYGSISEPNFRETTELPARQPAYLVYMAAYNFLTPPTREKNISSTKKYNKNNHKPPSEHGMERRMGDGRRKRNLFLGIMEIVTSLTIFSFFEGCLVECCCLLFLE
jgi:hypothetical protein